MFISDATFPRSSLLYYQRFSGDYDEWNEKQSLIFQQYTAEH